MARFVFYDLPEETKKQAVILRGRIAWNEMMPGWIVIVPHARWAVSLPDVTMIDPDLMPAVWYAKDTGLADAPSSGASPDHE